jgi:hypothetical protein
VTFSQFTFLEVLWSEQVLQKIHTLSSASNYLVVVLPDAWRDVLSASIEHPSSAIDFLDGQVEIQKVDKFTKSSYPFKAQRLELLLKGLTHGGFSLLQFDECKSDSGAVHILTFKRREKY